MKTAPFLAVAFAAVTLASCGPGHNNTASGTVVGAVAGGLLANQVAKGSGGRAAATALGAVMGGILGHEIGRGLDERDRLRAQQAEYRALEYGQSGAATPWRNPDTGRHGTVIPGRPYQLSGRHCRQFTHTIYIDGRPETMTGKACRRPDGTWANVS